MRDNFTKDELIRYVENTLSELKLVCLDLDDDDYDELLEKVNVEDHPHLMVNNILVDFLYNHYSDILSLNFDNFIINADEESDSELIFDIQSDDLRYHIKLKINPILHVYTSVFISDRPVNYITFTSLCLFRVLRMGDYNPKILNCECPKYRFVDEADYMVSEPSIHAHSSLN